jgi:hypothetical protein
MKKLSLCFLALFAMGLSTYANAASVQGKIKYVFAGKDNWYGVRFGLDITNDATNGICNTAFVYTEPKPDNGHNQKVAIFTAAYMAGKEVLMTVIPGRNGYCELVEGYMK